jgi:LPPG:FO 2-phospho-L-lactate transferase
VIVVLSGGVGAARLLRALRTELKPSDVTAIVNVGDDVTMHGLVICPDLDTITYTLAGLNNEELGWGIVGESWRVMDELAALGGDTWFRLGDRDLATHLFRTQQLHAGATKSQVTAALAQARGISERLLPATDDTIATMIATVDGEISFQEYFVARRHDVAVTGVRVEGAAQSLPAPGVLSAIAAAQRIIIAPSNPMLSIDPILAVPGVRDVLRARRDDVVAVSPLIGGHALKGPAERIMVELGHEATAVGVARYYRELISTMVIDEVDAAVAPQIDLLGVRSVVTTTVMSNPEHARQLAKEVLA